MSAKMATLGYVKIKAFWSKGYDVIISVHDVTKKILTRDSNYTVDVVMWLKLGNCSISMKKVWQPQFYKNLTRKTTFFEGWCWFKFINLALALSMALKFYTNMAKKLELKESQKALGANSSCVEVTVEKLVWGPFYPLHPK